VVVVVFWGLDITMKRRRPDLSTTGVIVLHNTSSHVVVLSI
jgi:hypothetical protein